MKPFRCLRPVDGWCRDCGDRPAVQGGMCRACWVGFCRGGAKVCMDSYALTHDEDDLAWANGLMQEADDAEKLLGVSHVLKPRRDH